MSRLLELKTTNLQIEVTDVESSNLKAIGYNNQLGAIVEFLNGGVYAYPSASREDYNTVKDADSVGSAFHKVLKPLPYVRLTS